jgi:hypothetical protein
MMDWHYHKDDVQTEAERKYEANIAAWQKAKFKHVWGQKDSLECPHCGSLVSEDSWRKHLKALHEPSECIGKRI